MVVRLRVKLGLFCAEVHYGIVLGVAISYFIGYYKVALKTGSKIVLQNSPTMQCDTTPPQSYAEPPKAQLPVVDFLFLLQQGGSEFVAVRVGRSTLQAMNSREVLVKKWPSPLKYQYYRSLLPDVSITLCSSCNRVSFSQSFVLRAISKWLSKNTCASRLERVVKS